MKRIVLLRHGESIWNKENRFTGWTDVELTPRGIEEADRAGELLREEGFVFGKAYVSYLKRAVHTLDRVLRRLGHSRRRAKSNPRRGKCSDTSPSPKIMKNYHQSYSTCAHVV